MAGAIDSWPGGLIRLGQDFRTGYGDGIVQFRIDTLSPDIYRETEIGAAAFQHAKGPHTFNHNHNRLLFDWYEERFSLLAGVRRVLNRL
ncbi:MAG TPA: hypothetical protein VNI79_01125 [Sphingomicrobium sp.]|nr:hypothetical protein [Sphingomicrobium sp.]